MKHDETTPRVRLLDVSRVTLGCAPSAGLYLRSLPYSDVEALFLRATTLGITEFDTAPLYGCGRSEIDLGRFATAHPTVAAHLNIATKVGRLLRPAKSEDVAKLQSEHPWRVEQDTHEYYSMDRDTGHLCCIEDYSAQGVALSFQESQVRLGPLARRITRLRIHDAETEDRLSDLLEGDAIATLVGLKRTSVVTSIGLGMNNPEFMQRIISAVPDRTFDHVLLAGAYNLMDTSGVAVLEDCAANGIDVHIAGVFGAGLLWGGEKYRYHDATPEQRQRRELLQTICEQHQVPLPWLAVHFATQPACVTRVVIGCATVEELDQCMDLFKLSFAATTIGALYDDLRQHNLIPAAVAS